MNAPLSTEQHCAHGFYFPGGCLYCANAEIENLRSLLSIAQDRNAEHCAEVQRLEKILRDWGIQGWERRAHDVPAKHNPKCKPDFPFHLCPVCYPGL